MQIIPFRDPAQWSEQIELDGTIYILMFTWNALNEFWVMDIYDRNEVSLILGIKIVPNFPLLDPYTVFGKPRGQIICQNVVNAPSNIGRFDIGQKFEMIYYSEGEFETLVQQDQNAI